MRVEPRAGKALGGQPGQVESTAATGAFVPFSQPASIEAQRAYRVGLGVTIRPVTPAPSRPLVKRICGDRLCEAARSTPAATGECDRCLAPACGCCRRNTASCRRGRRGLPAGRVDRARRVDRERPFHRPPRGSVYFLEIFSTARIRKATDAMEGSVSPLFVSWPPPSPSASRGACVSISARTRPSSPSTTNRRCLFRT